MLFFLATGLHLDVYAVAVVGAYQRREWIATGHRFLTVNRRTENSTGAIAIYICRWREAQLVIQF